MNYFVVSIYELSDGKPELVQQENVAIDNFTKFSEELTKRLKDFNEKNGTEYLFEIEETQTTALDDLFQNLKDQLE